MVIYLVYESHVHLSLIKAKQQKHHVGANIWRDVVTQKIYHPVLKFGVWPELTMLHSVEKFLNR